MSSTIDEKLSSGAVVFLSESMQERNSWISTFPFKECYVANVVCAGYIAGYVQYQLPLILTARSLTAICAECGTNMWRTYCIPYIAKYDASAVCGYCSYECYFTHLHRNNLEEITGKQSVYFPPA